jgi:NAD(P)H-dependent flavin oxidoreductase YrpB (nitropropane dioxygenase family)
MVRAMSATPVLRTRFTDAYGITHPIAQAGMAFASMTPDLAIACCHAGALGAFGNGKLPAEALRMFAGAIAGAVGDLPFNINFITIFTDDSHVDLCAELKVPVVSFHWGHPSKQWIDKLHAAGCKVWEQVGTVEAARQAVADGVDVVVAQGEEAGGHNYGSMGTFAMVPAVVDAVGADALVLASGGIADGRGLAAALALGADGAWVGTRLVASTEAYSRDDYKAALVGASGEDTVKTAIYGPDLASFNPMRVLRTDLVREWGNRVDEIPTDVSVLEHLGSLTFGEMVLPVHKFTNLVPTPHTEAPLSEMPQLAGAGVGLVHDIRPAAELIKAMVSDAAAQLRVTLG